MPCIADACNQGRIPCLRSECGFPGRAPASSLIEYAGPEPFSADETFGWIEMAISFIAGIAAAVIAIALVHQVLPVLAAVTR